MPLILTYRNLLNYIHEQEEPMAQLRYRSKITYDNRIFKATVKKDQPTRTSMWDDEFIHSKTLELFGGLTQGSY